MGSWTAGTLVSMSTTKEIGLIANQDSGSTSLYLGSHESSTRDISSGIQVPKGQEDLRWYEYRTYGREAFSEFFGTMILILFGDGVVAQVLLSHGQKGDYQSISWGWGYDII